MPIKPELLSPAGDFEKMKFAIAFGADAVYLGIPRYSLRARENGFKTLEDVAKAVDYAHQHGKKAYVTANIFAHNSKISGFTEYVHDLLAICRPDAWIMSDPGLIMLMREKFPDENIHISVQSNVMNHASAKFWKNIGAGRIILSREISIEEIRRIREMVPSGSLELEVFVHGAVCIAHSGRCLISNYLAHRDSNQGVCTNSCRWQYKLYALEEESRPGVFFPVDEDESGSYLMNAKDLCAMACLRELMEAGVDSFKIEGRSKTLYYLSMVTRAYRRAIDAVATGKNIDPVCREDINSTSARGFNEGFLHGTPEAEHSVEYAHSNSAYATHRFAGIVRGYDKNERLLCVEPRNPLQAGATYELCTPDKNIVLTPSAIFDSKHKPIDKIHGGLHTCWLPCPEDPGGFGVLREKIVPKN